VPRERTHLINRIGWLRAGILGANDGIISTASLILGVASAAQGDALLAGTAGLFAGALSMAAGEYVSVSSQLDVEKAEMAFEKRQLSRDPGSEVRDLAGIYVARGLSSDLAQLVAQQLLLKDADGAYARDALGISSAMTARPVQAALTSALSFSLGAAAPLAMIWLSPATWITANVALGSVLFLAILGAAGARLGGVGILGPTFRVIFWGAFAMGITSAVGRLFGALLS
jgi:VIT1/CCC1 family predicted Fe2+/Mn2+ transporter